MNLGKPGCDFFGWTKHVGDNVYLCPRCIARQDIPPKKTKRYSLPSALLMPAYIGFSLPDRELALHYARGLLARIKQDGHFYSDEEHLKNVGYDYGLLLYNMVRLGMDGADLVYGKLLDQVDGAGAWSEYYIEGRPSGTRYRPWESALNIEAIILYVKSKMQWPFTSDSMHKDREKREYKVKKESQRLLFRFVRGKHRLYQTIFLF